MNATVEAPTITLVHSVSGLLAEVDHLPMQTGPIYVRNHRLIEAAIEALAEKYPQLIIKGQSVDSETRVVLWVENV